MMSPTKNPKLSNFFAASLMCLNSSPTQLAGELWWCKMMAKNDSWGSWR